MSKPYPRPQSPASGSCSSPSFSSDHLPQVLRTHCRTWRSDHVEGLDAIHESEEEHLYNDERDPTYPHSEGWLPGVTMDTRKRKKKVLLMGKSGSGKSSMRSIIFSNFVAKDVRRLGATIDVEHSHAKFMGNLTLNLWDCGGQDAFMDSYVSTQRSNIFSDVAVLIYVFDIESREVNRDLDTYSTVIRALHQYSPSAYVFCLIHKMDLIQHEHREHLFLERAQLVKERSQGFDLETFASSIWDESLYKAWAGIVHRLIPNLSVIERFLHAFAEAIKAEEIVLFERSTFLTVTSVDNKTKPASKQKTSVSNSPPDSSPTKEPPPDDVNPNFDRHERISNILKTYKHTIARNTSNTPASAGFILLKLQTAQFNLFLTRFTDNTYVFVVVPPGEAAFNCAVLNTLLARESFEGVTNAR